MDKKRFLKRHVAQALGSIERQLVHLEVSQLVLAFTAPPDLLRAVGEVAAAMLGNKPAVAVSDSVDSVPGF